MTPSIQSIPPILSTPSISATAPSRVRWCLPLLLALVWLAASTSAALAQEEGGDGAGDAGDEPVAVEPADEVAPAPLDVSADDGDVAGDASLAPVPTLEAGASATLEHDPFADQVFPQPGEFTHSFLTTAQIIYLPDFILDSFFVRHPSHWDGRSNMAFGLDYVLRRVDSWELRAGIQWANLSMRSEYWLEEGKKVETADFTHFNLSVLSAEVSFFGTWDIIPEIGIFYGGGLWAGGVLGEVSKANIMQDCVSDDEAAPWLDEYERCPTDGVFEVETAVPPIVGMATASVGARFELAEHFVARLEGGFKGWFFGGLSLGGQFW